MRKYTSNKNIFTLGLVSLFTDISSEMIYPLLPIFLSGVLGVSMAFVGILEGIAESTASILKVFSGWFSDRVKRRKPIVLLGYILSTVGKPFLYFATLGWHVLIIRFIDRIGKGIRTSPRDALIVDSSSREHRGKAFGIQRALDHMGAFLGPLVAFILLPLLDNNLRLLFLIAFFPALIAVFIVIFFVREKINIGPSSKTTRPFSIRGFGKDFKIFVFIMAVFTLGNSSNAFLVLKAKEIGISTVTIPALWLMFNLVSSICSTPLGSLSDRIGRKKTTLLGFFIYGIVYLGFAFSNTQWLIWIFLAFYGVYNGLSEGVGRAYVSDLIEDKTHLATAYGAYHTVVGLCVFPASFIMGILWQQFSSSVAFLFGAILALLAAILLAVFLKR